MSKEQTMLHLQATFAAWEEQRDRCFALVSAVRSSLSKNENAFNELQLLDIAEEMLADTGEFQRLAEALGVAA
ncbi:MAG: hypothetical protein HHJ17_08665 [Rhodoferax sp.]|uniref:hypothetical protein n=1 Tax=Rhodoferax sp. TaxID=50421 RepID=UPI0018591363|nr:hypothetical protein [Rhodoferax sp.]NMM13593.1 hypothetical protein [Rhodoferax sp.]